jgi:hypothetical protein
MLSDRKPHGILCFLYREFRLDRHLYFIVATESQPFVGRVLGAYPAYSSPISSCIGAVPPAEPPSRDIKPWSLGQPWIKIRTILSTMSRYCQRGSIIVSCLLFCSLHFRYNPTTSTSALTTPTEWLAYSVSVSQDIVAFFASLAMGKRKYPRSSSLPRGGSFQVWGLAVAPHDVETVAITTTPMFSCTETNDSSSGDRAYSTVY